MEKVNGLKFSLLSIIGIIGGFISETLGGWDMALETLVMFMAIDYISGFVVAGVFKKSKKTESGALQSHAGFKGLCKKGMILFIVLIAYRLDMMTGSGFVRTSTIFGFIVNEGISIAENAGLMGVKFPDIISQGIDALNKRKF
jgi:toxin secretion/phage lysis holin